MKTTSAFVSLRQLRQRLLAALCAGLFAAATHAQSPLADLIQAGDSRGALALLQSGANVNTPQELLAAQHQR